jgi:hypothetical protein
LSPENKGDRYLPKDSVHHIETNPRNFAATSHRPPAAWLEETWLKLRHNSGLARRTFAETSLRTQQQPRSPIRIFFTHPTRPTSTAAQPTSTSWPPSRPAMTSQHKEGLTKAKPKSFAPTERKTRPTRGTSTPTVRKPSPATTTSSSPTSDDDEFLANQRRRRVPRPPPGTRGRSPSPASAISRCARTTCPRTHSIDPRLRPPPRPASRTRPFYRSNLQRAVTNTSMHASTQLRNSRH